MALQYMRSTEQSKKFRKNIGIAFIELHAERKAKKNKFRFEKIACKHVLLQMNYVQELFDFQVIEPLDIEITSPTSDELYDKWFKRARARNYSEHSLSIL